jgi:amino acid transporter
MHNDREVRPRLAARLRRIIIGGARDPHDPDMAHKMALIAFFAWVGLGADGLSSSCYGPSEVFLVLLQYPFLALFVALASALTVIVISMSYGQVIDLFPQGGGGYLVASRLLSPKLGMISGCALIIDYTLTIALSIASGADAIFSFLPADLLPWKTYMAVTGVVALTALNMRGVKESVVPLIPVFMVFVFSHLFAIGYVLVTHVGEMGRIAGSTMADVHTASSQMGVMGMILLMLRAYGMGAGTYTGIEAVSNGLPMLREPRARTGKRTMVYMASSLVVAVVGLMFCYVLCEVKFQDGKTLNAVMLESMTAGWRWPWAGHTFVLVTLASEAAILFVAAQTGFLGGPRVIANMALDRWLPNRFATLSDRLVTQNGVLLMGGAALVLILGTHGSVQYLVVLYSITVFITFVLAQSGMVRHWWSVRGTAEAWKKGLLINGIGLMLSLFILVCMTIIKFREGGWLTLVVTGALVFLCLAIRRHYDNTLKLLKRLDTLVEVSQASQGMRFKGEPAQPVAFDPDKKTAVILVSGYNGLGLHTLFGVVRLFGNTFKNYIFVQVGVIDAGNFKGPTELENLKAHISGDLDNYVKYMQRQGCYAEGRSLVGTDAVQSLSELVPEILEQYPQGICFAGQLVFPEETSFTRLLHNYVVFAVQRRLYSRGIPFVILPIRV